MIEILIAAVSPHYLTLILPQHPINIQGLPYAMSLIGIPNKEVELFMETTVQAINAAKGA